VDQKDVDPTQTLVDCVLLMYIATLLSVYPTPPIINLKELFENEEESRMK
jgi:hypothetical protein